MEWKKEPVKKIVWAAMWLLLLIIFVPIFAVGLHNYATGDDFWFGAYTYLGFHKGGIWAALKGSFKMIAEIYETWQGTWFTIFLFTLAPQNFTPHGYFITVFISVFGLFFAEYILLKRYFYTEYGFDKLSFFTIFFMVYVYSVQYIPRTTSGVFWFNGIMHYTIPLLIATASISATRQVFKEENRRKRAAYFVGIALGLTALGGSNYLAAILGLMGVGYETLVYLLDKWLSEKKIAIVPCIPIAIAVVLEFAGLFVSYKSPGNNIRSGDDMSFRPKYFLQCIWWSVDRGVQGSIRSILTNPVFLFIIVCINVIVFLELKKRASEKPLVKYPVLALLFVNGAHLAAFLPEVYSHSDVSGGVPNTHLQSLLFAVLMNILIVWDLVFRIIGKRLAQKGNARISMNATWVAEGIMALIMCVLMLVGPVKTTDGLCVDYIRSGRMAEYESIWWEQWRIFTDESVKEAIIPEYYEDVYPVCHMVLYADPTKDHNYYRQRYFEKDSVTAIDWKTGEAVK